LFAINTTQEERVVGVLIQQVKEKKKIVARPHLAIDITAQLRGTSQLLPPGLIWNLEPGPVTTCS
jgi:hypothetical protein